MRGAPTIYARAPYCTFVELRRGAEACYADYDYPSRKLSTISHVRAEGPVQVKGESAIRLDDLSFTPDGEAERVWRTHFTLEGHHYLWYDQIPDYAFHS